MPARGLRWVVMWLRMFDRASQWLVKGSNKMRRDFGHAPAHNFGNLCVLAMKSLEKVAGEEGMLLQPFVVESGWVMRTVYVVG